MLQLLSISVFRWLRLPPVLWGYPAIAMASPSVIFAVSLPATYATRDIPQCSLSDFSMYEDGERIFYCGALRDLHARAKLATP